MLIPSSELVAIYGTDEGIPHSIDIHLFKGPSIIFTAPWTYNLHFLDKRVGGFVEYCQISYLSCNPVQSKHNCVL